MIDSTWYPADFDDCQCKALDAAAEVAGTEDLTELAPYIKAIRNNDYIFLPDADNYADLGYEFSHETGLIESLHWLFDWERYGEEIDRDYGGEFTSYGWIAFFTS